MKTIPVIIDCDPGHDDAMALIMATASDKIDLKLVTTVSGNTTIEKTTKNALNVLHHIGFDNVPVAQGYGYFFNRPYDVISYDLEGNEVIGAAAHGKSGMDGFEFENNYSDNLLQCHAVEAMAKVLKESKDPVTIVPVGPLTNVALLLRSYPELKPKIKKISMMGGTCDYVFTKPFLEFNTMIDPEATDIVFNSGLPIDMFGYDVTYKIMYTPEILEEIKKVGNKTSEMVYGLLKNFLKSHSAFTSATLGKNYGDNAPIFDACAIAAVIDPALVTKQELLRCDVDKTSTYLRGATVFDRENKENKPKNINVIFDMNKEAFFELFLNLISLCE